MLTDERYKQLMENVGMPNSRSLLQALKQSVMEAEIAERERIAKWLEVQRNETPATGEEFSTALRSKYGDNLDWMAT